MSYMSLAERDDRWQALMNAKSARPPTIFAVLVTNGESGSKKGSGGKKNDTPRSLRGGSVGETIDHTIRSQELVELWPRPSVSKQQCTMITPRHLLFTAS